MAHARVASDRAWRACPPRIIIMIMIGKHEVVEVMLGELQLLLIRLLEQMSQVSSCKIPLGMSM